MKIAVVTQYFPNPDQPWGGHSAYQTVRVLAQRHQVQVFYPDAHYLPGMQPVAHAQTRDNPDYQPEGVSVEYIPYSIVPVLSRPFNGWLAYRRLLPRVRQFNPDVILNYVVYPDGYAALRIGRNLGVPVVLTAIGSDLNRISDRFCELLTRATLRGASFTTTVSHHLLKRARVLGALPQKSRAILNGCDTYIFRPRSMKAARAKLGLDVEGEVVVYVGRMDLRKGLAELVEAISRMKESRPAIRCYLVGGGPDLPALQSMVENYQLSAWIELRQPCPTELVALWMAAANVVTLPSYNEGCPNVVIEALAAGRPVVATNVGGIPELMDSRSGRLVAPRDVPALMAGLNEVLDSSWDAEKIASRHDRSWTDVAAELEGVLDEVVSTPTSSRKKLVSRRLHLQSITQQDERGSISFSSGDPFGEHS